MDSLRKRKEMLIHNVRKLFVCRVWIPAFAGMTGNETLWQVSAESRTIFIKNGLFGFTSSVFGYNTQLTMEDS